MNKTELVACIYKHVGRTDDLENLTELAEEIARMAAEEEREAMVDLASEIGWEMKGGDLFADAVRDLCELRSNDVIQGPRSGPAGMEG